MLRQHQQTSHHNPSTPRDPSPPHKKTHSQQSKLQTAVDRLKTDLAALEGEATAARKEAHAGHACKLSLNKVDTELASLRAALREAEEALLPPRVARLVRSASGQLADKWAELQANPTYGTAASTAADAASRAAALARQIKGRSIELAAEVRERAGPHAARALVQAKALAAKARVKAAEVQAELTLVIDAKLKEVPQLAPYADPVVVQALVYSVMGAPLLLLLPLLSALFGGSRRRRGSDDGKGKRGAARKGPAAGAKAGVKTGARKVVRDGRDGEWLWWVLFWVWWGARWAVEAGLYEGGMRRSADCGVNQANPNPNPTLHHNAVLLTP